MVTFTYKERNYAGYIASSTIAEPHFHWLFFTDAYLTQLIGDDSVAFQEIDGKLIHYNRIPLSHAELVQVAQAHIEDYLKSRGSSHK